MKLFLLRGDLTLMRVPASVSTLLLRTTELYPLLRRRHVRYLASALIVLITAALVMLCIAILGGASLMPFVAAVALATLFGTGPGICAVVLATFFYDFIFDPPPYHFSLDHHTVIAAGCFVVVALLTQAAERAIVRRGRDQKLRLLFFSLFSPASAETDTPRVAHPAGRLDGCVDGELYGWARYPADAGRAEKVTLYIEGRAAAEALAVHYRSDVGAHSFYFDLNPLLKAGATARVDVRFTDGSPLPNTPMKVSAPMVSPARRSQAVLFMHISKTAGTAFREALAENYRQSEIAYVYPDPPGMLCPDLNLLPLEQRRGFRLVIGHFQYGVHDFFPQDSLYVTIVREPVARIISEHRYLLEKRGGEPEHGNAAASLIAMLESEGSLNLDNLLVRCFSGVNENDLPPGRVNRDVYQLALDHVRNGFCFIGHQERLAEAYATLQHKFGWKPRPAFDRVNQTRFGSEEEYSAARAAIEEYNRWDLQLYEEIRRLFP